MHRPPRSLVGAERFGRQSRCKQLTGLAAHELRVLVAVMSCEVATGGFPTRDAIAEISCVDDTSMPSRLVRSGWLESAGKVRGNTVAYRATEKAWSELGVERPRGAEAAE